MTNFSLTLAIAIVAAALLSSCSVVLRPPACTASEHEWTPWHVTQAGDDWSQPIQERTCRICHWTQSTAAH
jgi:hypothetical protein